MNGGSCRRRYSRVLETLLAYNVQDTISLERLMVDAYNRRLGATEAPFAAAYRMALPETPANPFRADRDIIRRVQGGMWYQR